MASDTIEIPFSKGKLVKMLIICVVFLALGLWLVTADLEDDGSLFYNPVTRAVGGYGSILLGLGGVFVFVRKLLDKGPGVVLSPAGLYDNSSAFTSRLIPWSEVREVYEKTVQASVASKQHFVALRLADPDAFIALEASAWKRKLMKVNLNSYGSPVHISVNGLAIKHDELLRMVREFHGRYGNRD